MNMILPLNKQKRHPYLHMCCLWNYIYIDMDYNNGNPCWIKYLPQGIQVSDEDVEKTNISINIPIYMLGNEKKINLISLRSWWKDPTSGNIIICILIKLIDIQQKMG